MNKAHKKALDYIKSALNSPHLYNEDELEYLRKKKKEMKQLIKKDFFEV